MNDRDRTPRVDAAGGHRSLVEHAETKAREAHALFGPTIDLSRLLDVLEDRRFVRFPTRIAFDRAGLGAGLFAGARQIGAEPSEGFVVDVHPYFQDRPEVLPLLVAYHLPVVNYGDVVDATVAERFGAALLGLEVEEYYRQLCELADQMPLDD